MTEEEALALAHTWANRGVPVFPIAISWDPVKEKTNKVPLTRHGFSEATTDPDVYETLWLGARPLRPNEEWGVGIVPGPAGFVVLDPDLPYGPDVADADGCDRTWTVVTASGGEHRFFRKPDPDRIYGNGVPKRWAGHVDVRSDSGYIVAPGVTTQWGNWEPREDWDEGKIRELPDVGLPWTLPAPGKGTTKTKTKHVTAAKSVSPGPSWRAYDPAVHDKDLHPLTVEVHNLLVKEYDVDPGLTTVHSADGQTWLQVVRPGKAGGTSGTVGFVAPDVLYVFSSSWSGMEAGKAYSLADLSDERDAAQVALDRRKAEELERLKARIWAEEKVAAEQLEAARGPRTKQTAKQFATVKPPASIISDILAAELNLLGGPSAAGKSLLARDWALSVAAGSPWQGHDVPDARNVLWIASEGLNDFALRWTTQPLWGRAEDGIYVLDDPVNLVQGTDVDWLLEEYKDEEPGLVIFDVVYGMGMSDDTGTKDVLPVINNLKRISKEWGAATLALGHTGHNTDQRRFRGSSSWRQLAAAEWHMSDNLLTCEKSKITNHSMHDAPYALAYPNIDWLTLSGSMAMLSARDAAIRDDIDASPGDSVRVRARRLYRRLGVSEERARKLISAYLRESGS